MSSDNLRQRRTQLQDTVPEKRPRSNREGSSSQGWIGPFIIALFISFSILGVVFLCVPSPVIPVEYRLPEPPDLIGVLQPNDKLHHVQRLYEGQLAGPESIVVDGDHIYTGAEDGYIKDIYKGQVLDIVRFGKGRCGGYENEPTCGRVLGMRMDKDGFLIAIDSYFGIFKVNVVTGDYEQIVSIDDLVDGKRIRFLNDLDIAPNGKIYFSSSSSKWTRKDFYQVILEGSTTGRLLEYDPETKKTSILMEGLSFANGVQLTKDKSAVLVVDTLRARIWKYDIKSGKKSVWVENLPGVGDNIRYHKSTGTYWLGMAMVRQKGKSFVDNVGQYPWLRGQLAKVMTLDLLVSLGQMLNRADTKAMAIELDNSGNIIRSLQDTTGENIKGVSEVENVNGVFYLGSYNAPFLGRLHTKRVPNF